MIADDRIAGLAADIARVPGVVAVALGGSRARGANAPDSDVGLGIYVDDADRTRLGEVASQWSGTDTRIGPPGSWGPWVDSGAWLTVDGTPVDLILRDLERVDEQCARARRGAYAFHAQPGHPFGFLDVSYAGEVALGIPLADPSGFLRRTASTLSPYPDALRTALLGDLWQVDFILDAAVKGASRGDAPYVALCIADAVARLAHGWHAHSRAWAVNEKGLARAVDGLPGAPPDFSRRAGEAVAALGETPSELREAIRRARTLPRP